MNQHFLKLQKFIVSGRKQVEDIVNTSNSISERNKLLKEFEANREIGYVLVLKKPLRRSILKKKKNRKSNRLIIKIFNNPNISGRVTRSKNKL